MSEKEDQKGERESQDRQKDRKNRKGPALLEWIAAAIGAAITLALVTIILLEALDSSAKSPMISITPVHVERGDGAYVVEIEVVNRSGATAAALSIVGELMSGGEAVETSTATISYLPGKSTRRAGLIFTRDPRGFELELRATGYEVP